MTTTTTTAATPPSPFLQADIDICLSSLFAAAHDDKRWNNLSLLPAQPQMALTRHHHHHHHHHHHYDDDSILQSNSDSNNMIPAYRMGKYARRKLVDRVKWLHATGKNEPSLVAEKQVALEQLQNHSATVIQALFRGYRQRKPLSYALSSPSANRVWLVLERISRERRKAGRPFNLRAMTRQQLKEEKHVIKLILVGFDRTFEKKKGRAPLKAEKEQFRPIYQVYNEVKRLLDAANAANTNNSSSSRKNTPKQLTVVTPNSSLGSSSNNNNNNKDDGMNASGSLSASALTSATGTAASMTLSTTTTAPLSPEQLYSIRERIQQLKTEKRQLQVSLNHFEQKFRSQHGRQIMWDKDINPVREQYERYRALKKELETLTKQAQEASAAADVDKKEG